MQEAYLNLARKSLAFFTAVAARYDVQYILKVPPTTPTPPQPHPHNPSR